MNLLLLTHRVPYPPNRGDRIRAYHLLKFLSARHQVSLACLADEPVTQSIELKLRELAVRVAIVPQSPLGRWSRAALSFACGKTATSGMFASSQLQQTIRQWAKSETFDCVIAYCSSMAPYAFAPELAGTPVLVDLVDVDSQKWLDYSQKASGLKRHIYRWEGLRLRKQELQLTRNAASIALVSEAEAALFRAVCPNACTHAISNGVDQEYFHPTSSLEPSRPFSCVFVGALDYGANVDALEWFCTQVWPKVKRLAPQASLELVGRCPTSSVQRLAELPGVALAANVPDVRPYLERASVVIAPLRIARGIQNKVLEAMAMNKAVLASPGAIAGLDVQVGEHLVQAESPQEWITELLRLWGDESARTRMGLQARSFVEMHHAWNTTLEPWTTLIETCALPTKARNSFDESGEIANSSQIGEAPARIQSHSMTNSSPVTSDLNDNPSPKSMATD